MGCWAHVRRKFDEALKVQGKRNRKGNTPLAAQALKRIQLLYRIERKAKSLGDIECYELRQQRTIPVLDGLHEWLETHLPLVPPQSALGTGQGDGLSEQTVG